MVFTVLLNHSVATGNVLTYSFTYNNGNPAYDTPSKSYTVGTPTGSTLPTSDTPDFGSHVSVFDPGTPITTIQSKLDAAFNAQLLSPTAQFGAQRDTFFFKPGRYNGVYANLGFYTAIVGLGQNPDDVTLQGTLNVDSGWNYGDVSNATQNFWRSAENVALIPAGGTNRLSLIHI